MSAFCWFITSPSLDAEIHTAPRQWRSMDARRMIVLVIDRDHPNPDAVDINCYACTLVDLPQVIK